MSLSVLIVDDNARFLDASSSLLEQGGFEVVGVASTTEQAVARAEELRPDVVLVDIHLSGESGFDLVRELRARMPAAAHRVILMSTHAEADFAELIAISPVDGFVRKDALSAQAIRRFLAPA
jgi:DNA-binding NarL/FixJ family response regulator